MAGCLVEQKSRDGILAEVTAMVQGFDDIAELLNRLRNVSGIKFVFFVKLYKRMETLFLS